MSSETTTFAVDGGVLRLAADKVLAFPHPVAEAHEFPNVIVVRLAVPPGQRFNENVFGIGYDGAVAWQIPQLPHVYGDSPYTGLGEEDGMAVASNWDGLDVLLNPASGEVVAQREGR